MEVSQLKTDMDRQFVEVAEHFKDVPKRFEQVDRRFNEVHQRFEQVDQRFKEVDQRFERIDQQFEEVHQRFERIDRRFEEVHQRFERVDQRFEEMTTLILSEGERTRRHFDVVVEHLTSERNLSIDRATAVDERVGRLTAANAADRVEFSARLDDHDQRLTDLEPKRKP